MKMRKLSSKHRPVLRLTRKQYLKMARYSLEALQYNLDHPNLIRDQGLYMVEEAIDLTRYLSKAFLSTSPFEPTRKG